MYIYIDVCVCVCVCVRERERERECVCVCGVCTVDLQPKECSDVPANAQISKKRLLDLFCRKKKQENLSVFV
jgi:hypothetical protein